MIFRVLRGQETVQRGDRRYPFAPPVVCVNDYHGHLWEQAFHPDLNATAEEAYGQLDLLAELKEFHTKEFPGYWDGRN